MLGNSGAIGRGREDEGWWGDIPSPIPSPHFFNLFGGGWGGEAAAFEPTKTAALTRSPPTCCTPRIR